MEGEENSPEDWVDNNARQVQMFESARRLLNRGVGALQVIGGVVEAKVASILIAAPDPTGLTKVGGYALGLNAADNIATGVTQVITGEPEMGLIPSVIKSGAKAAKISETNAEIAAAIPNLVSFVVTSITLIKIGTTAAFAGKPAAAKVGDAGESAGGVARQADAAPSAQAQTPTGLMDNGSLAGKCDARARALLEEIPGSTLHQGPPGKPPHYAVRKPDGTIVDETLRDNLSAYGVKMDDIPVGKTEFTESEWLELVNRLPDRPGDVVTKWPDSHW